MWASLVGAPPLLAHRMVTYSTAWVEQGVSKAHGCAGRQRLGRGVARTGDVSTPLPICCSRRAGGAMESTGGCTSTRIIVATATQAGETWLAERAGFAWPRAGARVWPDAASV